MPETISGMLESRWFWHVVRLCLVVMFLASGLARLIDFDGGMAEMQAAGLGPAALFNGVVGITLWTGSVLILMDRAVWLRPGCWAGSCFSPS
jgi:transmembrane protein